MQTGDEQEISGWMRVWAGSAGPRSWEPGTIDLDASAVHGTPPGWIIVCIDEGRSMVYDAHDLRVCHPVTGMDPPPLPPCRWLLSCEQPAVRMQPRPLMSPVPVCAAHSAEHHLR